MARHKQPRSRRLASKTVSYDKGSEAFFLRDRKAPSSTTNPRRRKSIKNPLLNMQKVQAGPRWPSRKFTTFNRSKPSLSRFFLFKPKSSRLTRKRGKTEPHSPIQVQQFSAANCRLSLFRAAVSATRRLCRGFLQRCSRFRLELGR